jgi:hypothetical protein
VTFVLSGVARSTRGERAPLDVIVDFLETFGDLLFDLSLASGDELGSFTFLSFVSIWLALVRKLLKAVFSRRSVGVRLRPDSLVTFVENWTFSHFSVNPE